MKPRQIAQSPRVTRLGILLMLTAMPGPARAANLGDPAAPLKISQWIKGEPVDLKSGLGKTIHVVEFWATWCGPCRASIPRLSELQAKFKEKGVVFIGISAEKPGDVKPFVEKMGAKMAYTVAIDDSRMTSAAYMKAFGIDGIPHAFIVDKEGKVVWNGHPMAGLEETLGQVVAGKYDMEAAKKAAAAQKLVPQYFALIDSGKSKEAAELGRQIVRDAGGNAQLMNGFSWTILDEVKGDKRDLALALEAAKKALDASEGKDFAILDTYARALFDTGQVAGAVEFQKKALMAWDEAMKGASRDSGEDEQRKDLEKILKKYEEKVTNKQ